MTNKRKFWKKKWYFDKKNVIFTTNSYMPSNKCRNSIIRAISLANLAWTILEPHQENRFDFFYARYNFVVKHVMKNVYILITSGAWRMDNVMFTSTVFYWEKFWGLSKSGFSITNVQKEFATRISYIYIYFENAVFYLWTNMTFNHIAMYVTALPIF